jgi:hypothetical protein
MTLPHETGIVAGDVVLWIQEDDCVKLKIVKTAALEKSAMQEPVEAA